MRRQNRSLLLWWPGQSRLAQLEQPGPVVPGVIGVAIGAAVVTSFVAMRKKVNSADLYNLLADDVA